jgi:catechol 2,3-dioxygenase-like lactoylglutathione lyase family enzyme
MKTISRRELLQSIPPLALGAALAPRVFGQAAAPPIPIKALNYFELSVSDMKRSIDFYQGLFGMPIQARWGDSVLMRIGNGPQFMLLTPAGTQAPRTVPRLGLTVENFNADRIGGMLEKHGYMKAAAADPGLTGGAMKYKVTNRGNTPEMFVGDPDNFVLQVQDTTYAGGTGPMGNVVSVEASPKKGLIALKDMSHFTLTVSNATTTQDFYANVFGAPVRSRQATTPAMGIGPAPSVMFLMFIGGGGGGGRGRGGAAAAPPALPPGGPRAGVHHVSLNMENFNRDTVTKSMVEFGLTSSGETASTGPLKTYVSLRMPARGGAEGGTPELYFTDPDGLLIQIQDVKYCGGGGYLGDVCLG